MITKFKIYEALNIGDPEEDDYVIAVDDGPNSIESLIDFFESNIGIIKNIGDECSDVTYKKLTNILYDKEFAGNLDEGNNTWTFNNKDIRFWSKNIEDLEPIINAKKYNL